MGFADRVWEMGFEWLAIFLALWVKSIIVLATAALLASILRDASARSRHILWCAALFSLLVLPLFSGGLQPLRLPILPSGLFPNDLATQPPVRNAAPELPRLSSGTFPSDSGFQVGQNAESNLALVDDRRPRSSLSWQSVILLVWLIGVLFVLGRFFLGFVTVRRLVACANEPAGTSWSELLSELSQELRLKRRVRLLLSDERVMPMTCGGLSAVVLLPNEAEQWSADRRRVVILHELIHIKRRDLLTQTLAQVVWALYWFNPIVWWAVDRLRTEQEWACDELVVAAGIRRSDYAGHLLEIARKFDADALWAATTALVRPSQLQERLCAILKPAQGRHRSGAIAVTIIVMGVMFISTAVTQLTPAQGENGTNVSIVTNDVTQVEQKEEETLLRDRNSIVTDAPAAPASEDDHPLDQTPSTTPIDRPATQPPGSLYPPTASKDTGDYESEKEVLINFSDEERKRLLSNGVGPTYIKEMAGAGYRELTAAQLIALYSNAVRADYVAGLRSVGYAGLSTRDLLSLRTNGITPDVIRSFQDVRHASFTAANYVSLRSNGVTPSYFRSLVDAGYDSLTANQIVAMRLAGVTSEFISDARRRGIANLSPEELIELKRRERP